MLSLSFSLQAAEQQQQNLICGDNDGDDYVDDNDEHDDDDEEHDDDDEEHDDDDDDDVKSRGGGTKSSPICGE